MGGPGVGNSKEGLSSVEEKCAQARPLLLRDANGQQWTPTEPRNTTDGGAKRRSTPSKPLTFPLEDVRTAARNLSQYPGRPVESKGPHTCQGGEEYLISSKWIRQFVN